MDAHWTIQQLTLGRGISTAYAASVRPTLSRVLSFRLIPLTQGKFAIVDVEDYERLNRHKWSAAKGRNTFYAIRSIGKRPNRQTILMHKEILQAPKGFIADHKNSYGLDNRKVNMRICTYSQNEANTKRAKGASKYKGVHYYKQTKRWCAKIGFNKKAIHLGYFNNEIEAAKAYDQKAKELFGEFAKTNFKKSIKAIS